MYFKTATSSFLNVTILLSFEEIFSFLELIKNCPFLVKFCNLYKEQKQLPDKDYEYEIQQKDQEIQKLKQIINNDKSKKETTNKFAQITKKPSIFTFQKDIFKACKEGNSQVFNGYLKKKILI